MSNWSVAVAKEVLSQANQDPDVFCLLVGGLALSALPRPLRGIGVGLMTYVVVRRVDMIAHNYALQFQRLVHVMDTHE